MQEIEIKLVGTDEAWQALQEALAQMTGGTPSGPGQALRAVYFDTVDGRLAQARSAWRLRWEGQGWVQTLKMQQGAGLLRIEDNVPRDGSAEAVPEPDARVHPAEVQAILAQVLGGQALVPVLTTDILRHSLPLQGPLGQGLRADLDVGTIESGGQAWAVREVEIESCDPGWTAQEAQQRVMAQADEWIRRFGLWRDGRSKAERGERLRRQQRLDRPFEWPRAQEWALAQVGGQLLTCLDQACDVQAQTAHLGAVAEGLRQVVRVLQRQWQRDERDAPHQYATHGMPAWAQVFQSQSAFIDQALAGSHDRAQAMVRGAALQGAVLQFMKEALVQG